VLSFYLDEHIHPGIAHALRSRGIDVLTAQEAGRAGSSVPDPIQLAYATVSGRVFVSGDWDFLGYSAHVHPHAGVIILPRRVDVGTAALYLEIVATTGSPADYANQLLVYPALP
jgi:predicted nuclease of predicted toxin-antitoxin system